MAKQKVYELAKKLGVSSKDLLTLCEQHHIEVKNHMSTLEDAQVETLSGAVKKGAKPAADHTAAVKAEAVKTNAVKTETAKAETAKAEAVKAEAADKEEQPKKASLPISFTVSGIVTDVIPAHQQNAKSSMLLTGIPSISDGTDSLPLTELLHLFIFTPSPIIS